MDRLSALIAGKTLECSDGGEYPVRFASGTRVVVSDESGKILATGELAGGTQDLSGCSFTFKVDVPDATAYQLKIGEVGGYATTRSELEAQGWQVSLKV